MLHPIYEMKVRANRVRSAGAEHLHVRNFAACTCTYMFHYYYSYWFFKKDISLAADCPETLKRLSPSQPDRRV